MHSYIVPIIIGIICIVLGIFNTKGRISSIHWYHRRRITEENIIPFGKMVGLGTIIIGAALVIFGGLSYATELLDNNLFTLIGSVILIVCIIVGLGLSLFAMIKYNKGIF